MKPPDSLDASALLRGSPHARLLALARETQGLLALVEMMEAQSAALIARHARGEAAWAAELGDIFVGTRLLTLPLRTKVEILLWNAKAKESENRRAREKMRRLRERRRQHERDLREEDGPSAPSALSAPMTVEQRVQFEAQESEEMERLWEGMENLQRKED